MATVGGQSKGRGPRKEPAPGKYKQMNILLQFWHTC